MARVALKMDNAPTAKYDWCAKQVKDVHNSTALKSLDWKTPLELSTGETPDISMFNYYFWEPIWFYDPMAPKLTSKLKNTRCLGIAPNCGDALTYYTNTENEQGKIVLQLDLSSNLEEKILGQIKNL